MDDANVPSLLSLPYLGFMDASDPLYVRTRATLFSPKNKWWFNGTAGHGIGGPHVGECAPRVGVRLMVDFGTPRLS